MSITKNLMYLPVTLMCGSFLLLAPILSFDGHVIVVPVASMMA